MGGQVCLLAPRLAEIAADGDYITGQELNTSSFL
jgi:hypothetical protein